MRTLIKKELKEDMEAYGDDRRSPIVARIEAKAFDEKDLLSAEPITAVISKQGWIRVARGHDIDPTGLSYKSGDSFKIACQGRMNLPTLLLDSTGRSYTLETHNLPSARGQGEPVTGKISMPKGATIDAALSGANSDVVLLSSDAGYGFLTTIADLCSKNKKGKAALSLSKNAQLLTSINIVSLGDKMLAAITNEGRMLVFPVADLPELAKGKGNKIINVSTAKAAKREELMIALTVFNPGDTILVHSGKQHLKLKPTDIVHFSAERGRRGNKLPRGYQRVERVEVIPSSAAEPSEG